MDNFNLDQHEMVHNLDQLDNSNINAEALMPSIYLRAINKLALNSNDQILELGPGNGAHVKHIIKPGLGINYTGIDWSQDKVFEANQLNHELIISKCATFLQSATEHITFEAGYFNRALAIHTLYFWANPLIHLLEINRVLKPGSRFCLGFGDANYMKEEGLIEYGFNVYDQDVVTMLLLNAGFTVYDTESFYEHSLNKNDDVVNTKLTLMLCTV